MKTAMVVAVSVLVAAGAMGCKKKKAAGGETPAPTASGSPSPSASTAPSATAEPSASAAPSASPSAAPAAAGYCGANPCPCKADSEQKSGDKLTGCELEKVATVGGVECQPGRLLFHDDGSLEECLPTAETVVGDYTCKPSPLSVAWYPGGKLKNCSLAKEAVVAGITIHPGQGIQLHANGKLRIAYADPAIMIDGWSCTGYTYLFDDGKLESCTVTVAGKVGDQDVPAGSGLRLNKDGTMSGLRLGAKGKVAGKAAKKDESFCWEDGKPSAGQSCWMF